MRRSAFLLVLFMPDSSALLPRDVPSKPGSMAVTDLCSACQRARHSEMRQLRQVYAPATRIIP